MEIRLNKLINLFQSNKMSIQYFRLNLTNIEGTLFLSLHSKIKKDSGELRDYVKTLLHDNDLKLYVGEDCYYVPNEEITLDVMGRLGKEIFKYDLYIKLTCKFPENKNAITNT